MSYAVHREEIKESKAKIVLLSIFRGIYLAYNMIAVTLGAILLFLLDFPAIKEIILFITVIGGAYLALEHLTLLPPLIVISALFLPKKILIPFVLLSVVASFFIVLAI